MKSILGIRYKDIADRMADQSEYEISFICPAKTWCELCDKFEAENPKFEIITFCEIK